MSEIQESAACQARLDRYLDDSSTWACPRSAHLPIYQQLILDPRLLTAVLLAISCWRSLTLTFSSWLPFEEAQNSMPLDCREGKPRKRQQQREEPSVLSQKVVGRSLMRRTLGRGRKTKLEVSVVSKRCDYGSLTRNSCCKPQDEIVSGVDGTLGLETLFVHPTRGGSCNRWTSKPDFARVQECIRRSGTVWRSISSKFVGRLV